MSKSVFFAAAIMAGAMSAANASSATYSFVGSDGSQYCDGLTLTFSGGEAIGTHIAGKACVKQGLTEGSYAGGFSSKYKGSSDALYAIVTQEPYNSSSNQEVFYLDLKGMTWSVYYQDTPAGYTFQFFNSGTLVKGKPPELFNGKARAATQK